MEHYRILLALFSLSLSLGPTLTARADIWPSWAPLPLGYADAAEFEDYLALQQLDAFELVFADGEIEVIEFDDAPLVFDVPVPSPQTTRCTAEEYELAGFTEPIGWTLDPETGTQVPLLCQRQWSDEGAGEPVTLDGGNPTWWQDSWNWTDSLVQTTYVKTKSQASGSVALDTEFCVAGDYCAKVAMSTTNQILTTNYAWWSGGTLFIYPSLDFWAEAGPDAWDEAYLHTTRPYSN